MRGATRRKYALLIVQITLALRSKNGILGSTPHKLPGTLKTTCLCCAGEATALLMTLLFSLAARLRCNRLHTLRCCFFAVSL